MKQSPKPTIYPGLGNSTPKWKLDFLKKNGEHLTARQLSDLTGLTTPFIYLYVQLHNLSLKKAECKDRNYKPLKQLSCAEEYNPSLLVPEEVHEEQEEECYERPRAKYDNLSHDEMINNILNGKYNTR